MRWHIDLCGAEPIIRDVPVYDSTALVVGEMLMLGNSSKESNDNGTAFQTAYEGTESAECVDALGICMEATTDVAANANAVTADYAKAIINPFAVYLAEYSQTTGDVVALTETLSSTTLTISSHGDDHDAGWILASSSSETAGFAGQLWFCTADDATDMTLHATPTTAGASTTDDIVMIRPINTRLVGLNMAATKLWSEAADATGVSLHIMENYISSDELSLAPLRPQVHAKTANLSLTNAKAFADVVMLDHVYNMGD